jgi:DNA-binding transcriptional LysR family regulator
MDLRQLRTFVTVVDEGTVSKAALYLRIAQPALSRQIIDLEQELGVKLFDRVGRGLMLSAAGEQLVGNCRTLLGDVISLSEHAQLLQRGNTGVLKVGASPLQIENVLAPFLNQYARSYPNVQVKLIETVGHDLLTLLERGDIHLGINLPQSVQGDDQRFGFYPVPAVELLAACNPALRLERGNAMDVSRIALHPLLLLDDGFVVRKTFDAVCRLARLNLNIFIESRSPHTLLALAEGGHGIAIIPSIVQTHRYKLRFIAITYQRKPLREPICVVWDKRRVLPRYAQSFCELLTAHMSTMLPIRRHSAPKLENACERPRGRARPKGAAEIKGK